MNRRSALRSVLGAIAAPVAIPIAALLARVTHARTPEPLRYTVTQAGKSGATDPMFGLWTHAQVHAHEGGEWCQDCDSIGAYWWDGSRRTWLTHAERKAVGL